MEAKKMHVIPYFAKLSEMTQEQVNNTLSNEGFSGNADKINWNEFSYKPEVEFFIAHDNHKLFILFKVDEQNVRATYLKDNDAVWEDSCVEVFLSPILGEGYFNFELSCIGTALAAFGVGRENRKHWDDAKMLQIQRAVSLDKKIVGKDNVNAEWWLQFAIPFDLLRIKRGQTIFANFYKCGDKTKKPHFLSWQPITIPQPDFHQPKFFDALKLA